MFDEYFEPQNLEAPKAPVIPLPAGVGNAQHHEAGPSSSMSLDPEAPTISHSVTTADSQSSSVQQVASVNNLSLIHI